MTRIAGLICLFFLCLAVEPAWAAGGPPVEPALFRTTLRIEPSEAQLRTLPVFRPEWRLRMEEFSSLPSRLADLGFEPQTVQAILARVRQTDADGSVVLVPDEQLLDRFSAAERESWFEVLSTHPANSTHRWPLVFSRGTLDQLETDTALKRAVDRVRRWAVSRNGLFSFADLFALEGAFAGRADRRRFYRVALTAPSLVVKLQQGPDTRTDAYEHAAYWQVNGRYRAIEPMLNALAAIPEQDRLDLAHVLPRLGRALLSTYPPDLASAEDPGVESSLLASDFFALQPGAELNERDGFLGWIRRECVPATGPRQYGDILVFGDLERNVWPYAAVYIADGIVFARRPTAFGPWVFMPVEEIGRLNARFAARTPVTFRLRRAVSTPADPPFVRGRMPEAWRKRLGLKSLPTGPWGRLWSFDILLAPSGETLERLPPPDADPVWVFRPEVLPGAKSAIEGVEMPESTRVRLRELFRTAVTNHDGHLVLHPTMELIFETPREFRARVFPNLVSEGSATDFLQDIPFPRGFTIEEWFDVGSAPPRVREALLQLVYPSKRGVVLAEYGALYHAIQDPRERLTAQRAALRVPGLMLLLEKPSPAEVPQIAQYWSIGQGKSVRALLESFAANEDMRFLDVVHLLPPIAREFINTYFMTDLPARVPNCLWTSFNFGSDRPDDRFLVFPGLWSAHREMAWRELMTRFEMVEQPGQLGDIIAYRREGEHSIEHTCSYLAAGVVYTKNGFTFSSPWCLSTIEEVDAIYLASPGMEKLCFRARPPSS